MTVADDVHARYAC